VRNVSPSEDVKSEKKAWGLTVFVGQMVEELVHKRNRDCFDDELDDREAQDKLCSPNRSKSMGEACWIVRFHVLKTGNSVAPQNHPNKVSQDRQHQKDEILKSKNYASSSRTNFAASFCLLRAAKRPIRANGAFTSVLASEVKKQIA
jgi:hypothetical protein